ncbi:MAG: large conductance mechanosensitive channel protein MscL [Proteobacteria bacterium]|nr:large conductance mechanosensitive channel protein MscL [Pseudomonadota bacterium]
MLSEFKQFAMKGNFVDMAVGIVIGAAFGTIVSSLVNDVIMPLVGVITGDVDFSNMFMVISNPIEGASYATLAAAQDAGAVTVNYGLFINAVVTFLIVAFVLFMIIKGLNAAKKAEEEAAVEAGPPADIALLTEIRDALKK